MEELLKMRSMESVLDSLGGILSEARDLSANLSKKSQMLESRGTTMGSSEANAEKVYNEGIISNLYKLIDGFREVNAENRETFEHFDRLL